MTAARAYTVAELDSLRSIVEHKWLFGTYGVPMPGAGRSYNPVEKAHEVEELVRTHMLAGHTADDLHKIGEEETRQTAEFREMLERSHIERARERTEARRPTPPPARPAPKSKLSRLLWWLP